MVFRIKVIKKSLHLWKKLLWKIFITSNFECRFTFHLCNLATPEVQWLYVDSYTNNYQLTMNLIQLAHALHWELCLLCAQWQKYIQQFGIIFSQCRAVQFFNEYFNCTDMKYLRIHSWRYRTRTELTGIAFLLFLILKLWNQQLKYYSIKWQRRAKWTLP